ncbi:hypothetical protein Avbf_04291 [Armadillidium vulgare]|nr:hypothetical protein Avbf_04291 [Armadillidium vulgare]
MLSRFLYEFINFDVTYGPYNYHSNPIFNRQFFLIQLKWLSGNASSWSIAILRYVPCRWCFFEHILKIKLSHHLPIPYFRICHKHINATQDCITRKYWIAMHETCKYFWVKYLIFQCSKAQRNLISDCRWCPQVNRCSDGYDRHRQDWLEGHCESISIMNSSVCGSLPLGNHVSGSDLTSGSSDAATSDLLSSEAEQASSNSLWAGLLALFGVIVFICGWVAYAYLHPHSASGQILIKYRPSAWSLRRGEARYTAATMHSIHM